ncbi:IS110 family RNA-guided transposase [Dactylosporangium cerinum]
MPHARPTGHPTGPDPNPHEVILGVDTHKDVHVAAVITTLGVHVADATFPTTAAGYQQLLTWAHSFSILDRAGVEGTGSYGAALTRHLRRHQITVIEVNRPDRAAHRRHGKTDTIDAVAAAHAVLSQRATTTAKTADGPVEILRLLRLARASAVKSRTQAVNQLKAVIVSADPALRDQLAGCTAAALIRHCADLPDTTPTNVADATRYTLRRLARRIQTLTTEEHELQQQITAVLDTHAPQLLQRNGIGPDSASALLVSAGDNPDRMHTEASFAALCGVSPVEASSGKTSRRRLNRGGDRRANAALYRIALTRARDDQRTRDYLDRRTAQGHTRREIIRCLKRYIAREVYHLIQQLNTTDHTPRTA